MRRSSLVMIFSSIIALVVGAGYGILTYFLVDSTLSSKFISITAGTILTILLAVFALSMQALHMLSNVSDILDPLIESREDREYIEQLRSTMKGRRRLVAETGCQCLTNYLDAFHAVDHGFRIAGEDWSIRSYIVFWRNLLDEQAGRTSPLSLKLVHSSSIKLWEDVPGQTLFECHRKFRDQGGRIFRILIGKSFPPDDDYKRVIEKMEECGTEVIYLGPFHTARVQCDFLWVEEFDCIVKWQYTDVGGSIQHVEILDNVDQDIRQHWLALEAEARKSGWRRTDGAEDSGQFT